MKAGWSETLTLVGVVALVAAVTVLQGAWTDRWKDRSVSAELGRASEILERVFPETFGTWEIERELEADPKELERAGAVGHVSRLYRNARTKARVSAFMVCATPHDASGHTPDRCYPGAGFEIGETEHRQTIPLTDGRSAEAFTGTFRKTGQTLRIFWTYGVRDDEATGVNPPNERRWIAPQIARIALAGQASVYKLYAIVDETRLSNAQAMVECEDFLSNLLPALDAAVASATSRPREPDPVTPADGQPAEAKPAETAVRD